MADQLLGTVVRLQVQRAPLKPGPHGARRYDPSPLLEVDALEVGPLGVVGRTDAGPVLDVHHARHPQSRSTGPDSGLSLLPRAHYDALRARYGEHLADGAAGEGMLLETAGPWVEDDLAGTLGIETEDGQVLELTGARSAPPCVEFSRFCLGEPADGPVGPAVRQALVDLGDGARGFYLVASGSGVVGRGARLWRLGAA